MPATPEKYRALLFSERTAPNANGSFDLCRAATLAMLHDMATLGAWTTNPTGSRWGRARIARTLKAMRNATGEPLRGSYNQGHVSVFLGAMGAPSDTWEKFNRPWAAIVESLKNGYAFDLSGDVKHTPAGSPLRKYVNPDVGHNIALVGIDPGRQRVAFIDPMTPHGTRKYVRWAPYDHFRAFAREFAEGTNLNAGRVKIGGLSESRQVRTQLLGRIASLERDVEFAEEEITDLEDLVSTLRVRLEKNEDLPRVVELYRTAVNAAREVLRSVPD